MVTEIKDEDQEHDHQPVNAATEIPRITRSSPP